jgi:hypothetical protein
MAPSGDKDAKQRIANLIEQLSAQPQAKTTLTGRAIRRTTDALHLAISTGIVAIPLEEIEDVSLLQPSDKTLVSVLLKDISKVTRIHSVTLGRAASPMALNIGGGFGGFGGGGGESSDPTMTRCEGYVDSRTVTGDGYDATDDSFPVEQVDDRWD